MAGTCDNWEAVIEPLAINHTVIAPDFPGHGASAPGGGDYSLGSLASGLRDLMLTLGHERATLVGHSLGGGVALQFTYQFPEMVERLALVSSGGLGPDVSPILRAAALPERSFHLGHRGVGAGRLRSRPRPRPRRPAPEHRPRRSHPRLRDPDRPRAPQGLRRHPALGGRHQGQRVAALDKLYLAEALPLLIIWGENDPIIPVDHAREAHAQLPSSRLEIFEDTGHVPQLERPGRFIAVLERFLAETEPAEFDRDEWRARFKAAES